MQKKLTITLEESVYRGLHRVVGRRRISRFIENLVRPHVLRSEIENGYRRMAADAEHEREAREWTEELLEDVEDKPR